VLRCDGEHRLDQTLGRSEQGSRRYYPDYKIYVVVHNAQTAGTFALLIMDNLSHTCIRSASIEGVAADPE